MKHELRQMAQQGSGAIVNNASVGALAGNPGIGSYIASKHGVVGLTRTAALEYVRQGIRVNAVNPGLIDTPVARDVVNGDEQAYAEIAKNVPIGCAGRPEGIASAVLWLCSPGASYIVGHALTVDGGPVLGITGEGGAAGGDRLHHGQHGRARPCGGAVAF
jgi:NAD(P)-dependent dehydrogenase (short-subunit alcohol dehydrogenase family)